MAGVATISPFHFQKLFIKYVGESPKQYVLRLRLERSAHHLVLYPEQSVFEVSLQSGFSSASTFGRAFKNYFGITPDEFRKASNFDNSKIGTSIHNNRKEHEEHFHQFWSIDFDGNETIGQATGEGIHVAKLSSLKIAYIDTHLGNDNAITNAFKALYSLAFPHDLITGSTRYFGIYLDLPFFTEPHKCRFRACISLPVEAEAPKDMATGVIDAGKYASYSVTGNTSEMLKTLVAFKHGWLDPSGYQISATACYEEYPANPAFENHELSTRTVYIPIQPV
jgi:AraC family transcriptional regulator